MLLGQEKKTKKEICRFCKIRILTGNSKNQDDLSFDDLVYELIKYGLTDVKMKVAGVDFEEMTIQKSTSKFLKISKDSTRAANNFIVLSGWFKIEDSEFLRYVRSAVIEYGKTINNTVLKNEVSHSVRFESKFQVVTEVTTDEKESSEYISIIYQNKN